MASLETTTDTEDTEASNASLRQILPPKLLVFDA